MDLAATQDPASGPETGSLPPNTQQRALSAWYLADTGSASDGHLIPTTSGADGVLRHWESLPARPLSACPMGRAASDEALVVAPEDTRECEEMQGHASAVAPAHRLGPAPRPSPPPVYRGFVKHTCFIAKIPGYEPSQISPGYEERLAALVAAAPAEGNAASAGLPSMRRLAGVYVRQGCIEMLMETEDWNGLEFYDAESSSIAAEFDTDSDVSLAPHGPEDDPPADRRDGASAASDALPHIPSSTPGTVSTSPTSMPSPAITVRLQLARSHTGDDGAPHAPALLHSTRGPAAGPGRAGPAEGLLASAVNSGGTSPAGPASAAVASAAWAGGRRGRSNSATSSTSSKGVVDLAAVIRALRLRDDGATSSVSTDEDTWSGDVASGSLGAAKAPRAGAETPEGAASPRAGAGAGPESACGSALPGSRGASLFMAPLPAGVSGDLRAAVEVSAMQPRVLLLQAPPWEPPHAPPHSAAPQPTAAVAAAPPGTNSGTGAALASAQSVFASATSAAAAAATASVPLHAVVHCAADLRQGVPPSPLEILVRSHNEYLPVLTRWARPPPPSPPPPATAAAAAAAAAAAPDPAQEQDVPSDVRTLDAISLPRGGAVPGPAPGPDRGLRPAPAAAGVEAEVRLSPGPQGGVVPDVAARPDVNLPQLLEVELLRLPRQPGLMLVDFRWYGRPCGTVPLVVTRDPNVAAELQATAAQWPRTPAELDEFLLDFGTWEFHASAESAASAASAPAPPAAAAAALPGGPPPPPPLDPVSLCRLRSLGAHLLRYATACKWQHTAAHVRQLLGALSPQRAAKGPDRTAAAASANGRTGSGGGGEGGGEGGAAASELAPAGPVGAAGAPVAGAPPASRGAARAREGAAAAAGPAPARAPAAAPAGATYTPAARRRAGMLAHRSGAATTRHRQPHTRGAAAAAAAEPPAGAEEALLASGSRGGADGGGGGAAAATHRSHGVSPADAGAGAGACAGIPRGPGRPGGQAAGAVTRLRAALAALLVAVGLRCTGSEEEAAFREYAGPWIFAQGSLLPVLDTISLLTLLFRARRDILAPCNMTAVVASSGGLLITLAQLLLPRAAWVRLVNGYRLPRFLFYSFTKCMIAFLGFPPPPGVLSYATSFPLLIMEGVIVPGASLLPTPVTAAALALLSTSSGFMLHTCGASAGFAAMVALRTWAVGVLTTIACHTYMRACFLIRQQAHTASPTGERGMLKGERGGAQRCEPRVAGTRAGS